MDEKGIVCVADWLRKKEICQIGCIRFIQTAAGRSAHWLQGARRQASDICPNRQSGSVPRLRQDLLTYLGREVFSKIARKSCFQHLPLLSFCYNNLFYFQRSDRMSSRFCAVWNYPFASRLVL